MRFKCQCGHTVIDNGQFDHLKGQIIRAQSFEVAHAQPCAAIAGFIRSITEGKRQEWIENFYGRPFFEMPDNEVVSDIILHAWQRTGLDIYQCEACGRIFVERAPNSNMALRSFKPEDSDWKGTLSDDTASSSAGPSIQN